MYKIERKSEIINMLEQAGKVNVNDLSQRFSASRETIRRDLEEMELDGVLKRTHGGAVFYNGNHSTPFELPVVVREIQRYSEKNEICKKAVSLIRDGDNIFVDNSSTCLCLMKYIPSELKVTIITNSIKLLTESVSVSSPNHMVVCLGGILNAANHSLYGNTALKNAAEFYPNISFMSCTGVQPGRLTDSSFLEVDIKRMMIERSNKAYILADYSKFEKSGQVFLADFSQITAVITDGKTPKEQSSFLENSGVSILFAE
jgi:DeoR family transcriptional regulator, fructose operon transcriptional repressor